MSLEKIKNIKLSLMEICDSTNMDPTKIDAIIRTSIYVNFDEVEFDKSEDNIKDILEHMYETLLNYKSNPEINYVGIWVKCDEDLYDNSIKIQSLDDISNFSSENISPIFEFLKMTLPS